jgi:hypothetical protein
LQERREAIDERRKIKKGKALTAKDAEDAGNGK